VTGHFSCLFEVLQLESFVICILFVPGGSLSSLADVVLSVMFVFGSSFSFLLSGSFVSSISLLTMFAFLDFCSFSHFKIIGESSFWSKIEYISERLFGWKVFPCLVHLGAIRNR